MKRHSSVGGIMTTEMPKRPQKGDEVRWFFFVDSEGIRATDTYRLGEFVEFSGTGKSVRVRVKNPDGRRKYRFWPVGETSLVVS